MVHSPIALYKCSTMVEMPLQDRVLAQTVKGTKRIAQKGASATYVEEMETPCLAA
jgi:hypothetical protein